MIAIAPAKYDLCQGCDTYQDLRRDPANPFALVCPDCGMASRDNELRIPEVENIGIRDSYRTLFGTGEGARNGWASEDALVKAFHVALRILEKEDPDVFTLAELRMAVTRIKREAESVLSEVERRTYADAYARALQKTTAGK